MSPSEAQPNLSAPRPIQLENLLREFKAAYQEEVADVFGAKREALADKYAQTLKEAYSKAIENGQLEIAVDLKRQIDTPRIDNNAGMPEVNSARAKKLLLTYQAGQERIEISENQKLDRFLARFTKQLKDLEREFTKAEELENALTVHNLGKSSSLAKVDTILSAKPIGMVGPIHIRINIDARTHMRVQGNHLWLDHRHGSWGRPTGNGKTPVINGNEWTPKWDEEAQDVSEKIELPVSFPVPSEDEAPLCAVLENKRGNCWAYILEQPTKANDYMTVIEFFQDGGGWDWMDLELSWQRIDPAEAESDKLHLDGHTYRVVFCDGLTWKQCRAEAQALGGDLVSLETPAEQKFLYDHLFPRHIGGLIALGGMYDPQNGIKWVNGRASTFEDPAWAGAPVDKKKPHLGYRAHKWHAVGKGEASIRAFIVEWPKQIAGSKESG